MAKKKHRYLDRYASDRLERDFRLEVRGRRYQANKGKGTRRQQLNTFIKESYTEAEWR